MTEHPLIGPHVLAAVRAELERRKWRWKDTLYPDRGPLARAKYHKHLDFFAAGASYRQRALIAANRVGKTIAGAYEVACHLTGEYPAWWQGWRFDAKRAGRGCRIWVAGDTAGTVRDIIQHVLMGAEHGSAMIPRERIYDKRMRAGVPNALDMVWVNHATGKRSQVQFKSYDQRRESFQGTEQDVIWLDEECPEDVYAECLTRTMTTGGRVMLTFTPLKGITPVVLAFLPGGKAAEAGTADDRHVTMLGWDDAPHLSEEAKAELLAAFPVHEREARSKGVPMLGSGKIYPCREEDLLVEPFAIPDHWPRAYGLDVGWNRTAAVWGALDRETDTWYLYDEHYGSQAEPAVHAAAIRGRGEWVRGVIDPASRGANQADGRRLVEEYRKLGLDLEFADNAVEAGIHACWTRMTSGRLKVFQSCSNWRNEWRLYRRDEKGKVVKENDHALDAGRYLVMSGAAVAQTKPVKRMEVTAMPVHFGSAGWMA